MLAFISNATSRASTKPCFDDSIDFVPTNALVITYELVIPAYRGIRIANDTLFLKDYYIYRQLLEWIRVVVVGREKMINCARRIYLLFVRRARVENSRGFNTRATVSTWTETRPLGTDKISI